MRRFRWSLALVVVLAVGVSACGDSVVKTEGPSSPPQLETKPSNLSTAAKRDRAKVMKRVAASEGLTNAIVLAGIAEAETHFAHCWHEATWACQGPHSSFCGGPVIAGGSDGACSRRQGGLGMFQFDAGTYDDTLRREGRRVISLEGNIDAAVDFVADMVRDSTFIAGVDTRSEAISWMNGVEVGGRRYRTWIKTVTAYYNGCFPGDCGIYNQRFNHYDNAHRRIHSALGAAFWDRSSSGAGNSSGGSSGGSVGAQPPSTPRDIGPEAAEIGNHDTVDLTWQEVSGATRYVLEVETKDGAVWNHYHEWQPGTPPFRVWPQLHDTTYRWRVQACGADGCSEWSAWHEFAVGAASIESSREDDSSSSGHSSGDGDADDAGSSSGTTLNPPAGLTPNGDDVASQSTTYRWNPVEGASSYVVNMRYWDRGSQQWKHYHTWSDVGGTSKQIWPILDGRTYVWRVRACTRSRCGSWSDWAKYDYDG